jgi:hypothetical protein
MAFDLTGLSAYTDELSFDLISKAVLTTELMESINVQTGLAAGTVAINLMDGDLNVSDRSCGFSPSGDINFTQVDITIVDKQIKMTVCPEDLRSYYVSQKMSPSAVAGNEEVPFEEVIADYYIKKIKNYNEGFLINGDGVVNGIKAQITTGNGANLQGGTPAAWTASNAVEQALDLYDAIGEAVIDRDDLIMIMSPANYRALTRGLVAANLFHYQSVEGNEAVYLPGTNVKLVKSSGLSGSDYVAAGPAEFIVAGTGLTDDMSSFAMMYDPYEDIVKVRAYWRLGVAVHQINQFATNGLS